MGRTFGTGAHRIREGHRCRWNRSSCEPTCNALRSGDKLTKHRASKRGSRHEGVFLFDHSSDRVPCGAGRGRRDSGRSRASGDRSAGRRRRPGDIRPNPRSIGPTGQRGTRCRRRRTNFHDLEAEVPSIHAGAISPGQTARIQIEDSRELSGRVRQAPAAVDQRTQLGRARLSLERDPWLRLGMFARATIDADRSCGISVPRSAVHYRTEGPRVQVVRDNVIETRVVQVGFHSDMDIEIREGLREGDLIVANAGSSLRDGDKVNPIMADTLQLGQR